MAMIGGCGGGGGCSGGPPQKRMKFSGSSGDKEKDHLVDRVKVFQKANPEQRAIWEKYAEDMFGGIRDPAKQTKEALLAFISHYAVPDVQERGFLNESESLDLDQKKRMVDEVKRRQKGSND